MCKQYIHSSINQCFWPKSEIIKTVQYKCGQYFTPEAAAKGDLWKKVFLKILQNWQENTRARVSFLIKSQGSACNFIKKGTLAQVFSSEFCEISTNTFLQNTSSGYIYHTSQAFRLLIHFLVRVSGCCCHISTVIMHVLGIDVMNWYQFTFYLPENFKIKNQMPSDVFRGNKKSEHWSGIYWDWQQKMPIEDTWFSECKQVLWSLLRH